MVSEKFILCVLIDRFSDNGGRNYSFQSFISECAELNKDMIEELENTASGNFSGDLVE
jgi:hypothetical protein